MHLSEPLAAGMRRKFVGWEERHISQDKGSRLVHYYLKDRHGFVCLAAIGSERSLRHMVYVVADEFLPLAGNDKSPASWKWRSRRGVLDWLSTFLVKPRNEQHPSKCAKHELSITSDHDLISNGEDTDFLDGSSQDEGRNQTQSMKKHPTTLKDILWIGAAWSCRKRLQHYRSFQRNGITISVHNFVYVMSESNGHHIAYIEDMYEDRKATKKLRVRWFHKTEELVGPVPPPAPHPKEVFMTPFPQVLSVECVDGLATVLTPEHYVKCLTFSVDAHICFRQFDNEGVKPFTISNVEGYWHQKVFGLVELPLSRELSTNCEATSDSMEIDEDEEADIGCIIKRRRRTARYSKRQICMTNQNSCRCTENLPITFQPSDRLVSSGKISSGSKSIPAETCFSACYEGVSASSLDQSFPAFHVGDKVELLCQDSGIRGCWYICTVLRRFPCHLKVRYEELETEDGHGKLEEWIPSVNLALPDRLGIRTLGRPTVRPLSSEPSVLDNCEIGSAVDAWWNDGWWEGIILSKKATEILVYFPDENDYATFQPSDLRLSRDWFNGKWVDVKSSIEVMKTVSSMISISFIPCFSARICSRQSSSASQNISTVTTGVPVPAERLKMLVDCSDLSDEHEFLSKCKIVSVPNDSSENLKENHSVTWTSESKAYTEVKKESPGALLEEQWNTQSCELQGKSDSVSIQQDHTHSSVFKGEHEVGLHQGSFKKRPYELDVVYAVRNESGNKIMCEQKSWSEKGEACLQGLKENDLYEIVTGAEGAAKVKIARTMHETLKPLQGPPMSSSLFINSAPLAGLVMSR